MPQSLSNILVHLVFSTKNRDSLILPAIEDQLWRYLSATCTACGCQTHRIGGTKDHIHIACGLARTIAVSDLVEEIKKSSSKWMKTKGVPVFAWQNGYGAFSIGQSQLKQLIEYIDRQKEHHHRRTFQEEYRELLKKYRIQCDERYVWD
ncbi:MAG: IS200/IS605 family transposase [Planctomycetes bacterium]|nr:IS200/IS605 family transposase [Planctomycetota bacterium]